MGLSVNNNGNLTTTSSSVGATNNFVNGELKQSVFKQRNHNTVENNNDDITDTKALLVDGKKCQCIRKGDVWYVQEADGSITPLNKTKDGNLFHKAQYERMSMTDNQGFTTVIANDGSYKKTKEGIIYSYDSKDRLLGGANSDGTSFEVTYYDDKSLGITHKCQYSNGNYVNFNCEDMVSGKDESGEYTVTYETEKFPMMGKDGKYEDITYKTGTYTQKYEDGHSVTLNEKGDVIKKTDEDGTTWVYNENGTYTSEKDGKVLTYNSKNQMIREEEILNEDGIKLTLHAYEYDENGTQVDKFALPQFNFHQVKKGDSIISVVKSALAEQGITNPSEEQLDSAIREFKDNNTNRIHTYSTKGKNVKLRGTAILYSDEVVTIPKFKILKNDNTDES